MTLSKEREETHDKARLSFVAAVKNGINDSAEHSSSYEFHADRGCQENSSPSTQSVKSLPYSQEHRALLILGKKKLVYTIPPGCLKLILILFSQQAFPSGIFLHFFRKTFVYISHSLVKNMYSPIISFLILWSEYYFLET